MARIARVDIEDSWYHIMTRGINRQKLFMDATDYETYLKIVDGALKKYNGYIGAYCLMTNHVHLLIYRQECKLGKIFHKVHGEYGRYFNKKYRRSGYLFQGRYKSKLVVDDKYLVALLNYIHTNPVRAHIVKSMQKYRWTTDRNYRSDTSEKLERFKRVPGFEGRGNSAEYSRIMGIHTAYPESSAQHIGTKESVKDHRRKSVKRYQRERRGIIPLKDRIDRILGSDKKLIRELKSTRRSKDIAAKRQLLFVRLYKEGYGPCEIAEYFKRTPSSVIRAVERFSQ